MDLFSQEVEKVVNKDIDTLLEIIDREFPYTTFTKETLEKKIADPKFFIIKHHQKNILTAFMEVEFLDKEARLNAIFVEEAWRGQGIAKKLVKRAIHECKRKRLHRLFLLVKAENSSAKGLYKDAGFKFVKMHDKELDNSQVEVWEISIN